ncbi:YegP family protein [Roseomonas haemaphysalidis]|uniref:DUF1508 domain-containing protein n=1 Tax=Roseomonas haemaphysalidis TaxID=2768162 RepID=A0ABS3KU64_9PROT|nr:DUF1508 domain-containing protein [Roseomonas haemaphysalidis]MBO1079866.1 DUF1508 domain-containing protein [Roseomonas haemaphysalidis]
MYFTIFQRADGQWQWNLKAANHEIIAQGESYKNKSDCLNCISLVRAADDATPIKERAA